ncbi:MFS transporter [Trinickia mobilis]|uniref:MFS transporter n=1 Tax=Trinickia mobilis TaxID=2816356 RepID=UPI0028681A93|nr:MFS transporter [Trinickia mobilis]
MSDAIEVAHSNSYTGQKSVRIILAASLGGLFEYYDFFLYSSMAPVISKQFFSGVNGTLAFKLTLLTFASGFLARPIGGVIFGRFGDLVGRKRTFLATMALMGLTTFAVGALPTYATWGTIAPIVLVILRVLQGLAIGGEYGGAAIYVAEHAPSTKRGLYTSWVQTTAGLGILLSLLVIGGLRVVLGPQAFNSWGWRLPFLFSIVLLGISLWVRLSLQESPLFIKMRSLGKTTKAPLRDTFSNWRNVRVMAVSMVTIIAGIAVIQFTGLSYTMFFLTQSLKLDAGTAGALFGVAIIIGIPTTIIFGKLSDHIGRKTVIVCSYLCAIALYVPLFNGLTKAVNPALAKAVAEAPVTVVADPSSCDAQFNPIGTRQFESPCDIAKSVLAQASIPYRNEAAPAGAGAYIRIGSVEISSYDGRGLDKVEEKARRYDLTKHVDSALAASAYPRDADVSKIDYPVAIAILTVLIVITSMGYGPLAATLVELFPAKIRYTALSLPFHTGVAIFGGLLPSVAFAIVTSTGNMFSGLYYPMAIAAASLVFTLALFRETKGRDISE